MRFARSLMTVAAALTLTACSGDDSSSNTSATSTSTSSTSTTTETSTSGETTDATESGGSTTTTGTTTGTSADPTTTTTGDTTTTTTGGLEFPICADYCDAITACFGDGYPECFAECNEFTGVFHALGPVCTESIDGLLECAIDLPCEELGAFLNEEPSPCDDAQDEIDGDPPACLLKEEPPEFCVTFCDKMVECMFDEPGCLDECTAGYGFGKAMSQECGDALEAYYGCLGELDCDNLMNPVTCLDEATKAESLCDF